MKILMVLTSHDALGNTGQKTGLWLEEFASPYYYFKDEGCEVTLVSPQGGCPPLDPKSNETEHQTDATRRYKQDLNTQKVFSHTLKLSEVKATDFDGVFFPGGHGPLWDLVENDNSISLIKKMLYLERPVGSVCHGPAVLLKVTGENGIPVIQGKNVTSFSNEEERAIGLEKVVPYMIESCFQELGAIYSCREPWMAHVVVDDCLITGQNPASSVGVAKAILEKINSKNKGQ